MSLVNPGTASTFREFEELCALEEDIETRSRQLDAIAGAATAGGRDLTESEIAAGLEHRRAIEAGERKRAELRQAATEHRSRQIVQAIDEAAGRQPRRSGHSPLVVSEVHLRSHADAIRAGSVFGAEEELEQLDIETRATVAVTDMGSPGAWGAGQIRQPVTLRQFARIPNAPLTGSTAQMPSVTLPAGAAGVAEGANHTEFDSIDPANLTTLRYGRWTAVTSFVDAFDDLQVINRAHAVGIARDLNLVDATAIIAAATSVTAFSATALDQNVRAAILKVAAAALVEPTDVVLIGSSTALAVVNGFAPASGEDRGSVALRVFGARTYVHEPTTAGNVYAFAPSGFQTFSDRLRSASTIDAKNGSPTFGQWIHSTAPGLAIVGSCQGVDVVTP
jgi:hypothetical protein